MNQLIHNRQMKKIFTGTHKEPCTAHCYHMASSYMRVLPEDHVLQKCCHCCSTRTIHRDHLWEKSANNCSSIDISWK